MPLHSLAVVRAAIWFVSVVAVMPLTVRAQAQPSRHSVQNLADIKWNDGGAGLASAVLDGDPSAAGKSYSLLLKLRDGFWIQPHWHPFDKRVVVLQGTMLMGMGDVVDASKASALSVGGTSLVPAETHHFEGARGETILLLYGTGPLTTNFIKLPAKP